MGFSAFRFQKLTELRAPAPSKAGFEKIDAEKPTANRRGPFGRQLRRCFLKTGRFPAKPRLIVCQNSSRQTSQFNKS
jgi:hypothetical protein